MALPWASRPGFRAERPRVRIGQRVIAAAERTHADAPSGAVAWTYHARVDGLRPGATYGYAVTADNDANAADPFSATFTTAPAGRAAFRFTSFGDLAAPSPVDNWQAAYAVGAVETLLQPLSSGTCSTRRPAHAGSTPGAPACAGPSVTASRRRRPTGAVAVAGAR